MRKCANVFFKLFSGLICFFFSLHFSLFFFDLFVKLRRRCFKRVALFILIGLLIHTYTDNYFTRD